MTVMVDRRQTIRRAGGFCGMLAGLLVVMLMSAGLAASNDPVARAEAEARREATEAAEESAAIASTKLRAALFDVEMGREALAAERSKGALHALAVQARDDEIAALLVQLEDATAVEAVQVIEVHADGYDEVDALIAEIEAELAMADGEPAMGAIDLDAELEALMAEIEADLVIEEVAWEPVVEEAVLVDVEVLDAKQERIDELEGEVAELRELVESLVRELNER